MAIRTYKVTLDLKNTIAPEPVFLRQGDKTGAVVIDATLMDNGAPVSLRGLTPMFKANTADGQAVIADSTGFNVLDSANGEFTYQVPNALSAVPGKITTAYFSFSDSSGSESTFDVAFIIKKAVDISKPQADDYITIIDGTIQSLQQKIDAMNTDIQTILNAYKQGDFYNKSETDSKDAATLASAKTYADKDNYYTKAEVDAKTDVVNISDWINLPTRNGFSGFAQVRTTKYSSGKTKVDFYMEAGGLRANTGKYMCDFPAELVPSKELPLTWAQPNNNDYDKIGASVGGTKTSIELNYAAGGSGDLVVLFNLSYWLDV